MADPYLDLCACCKAIEFHTLPAENEAGVLHQPSLTALRSSAQTCSMCRMLLQSAYLTRGKIREHHCGGNNFPTGIISYQAIPRESGENPMMITDEGHYFPGTEIWSGTTQDSPPRQGLKDDYSFDNTDAIKPYLYGNWWNIAQGADQLQLIGLGIRLGTGPNLEDAEGNDKSNWYCRGSQLRVRTIKDNPANAFIPGRLRLAHAGSRLGIDQIEAWMRHCELNHRACRIADPILPTRVLEISQESFDSSFLSVRLVDGEGRREKYIALSHCWGKAHAFITTSENLAARQERIDFSTLPATFKEAIQVTSRLGVQYLWIDSLCILQDVVADWEQEAPKMADVYNRSYLTLSASNSADDSAGLYPLHIKDRSTPAQSWDQTSLGRYTLGNDAPVIEHTPGSDGKWTVISQQPFSWNPWYKYSGKECDIFLSYEWMPTSLKAKPKTYLLGHFGRPYDPIADQHLQSRAWTLQERVLAPRTVHFASDQMYWECSEAGVSEDGCRFNYVKHHTGAVLLGHTQPLQNCGAPDGGMSLIEGYKPLDLGGHARWKGSWLSLVEEYTKRNLTFESDRLSAMSGLANLIARKTGDRYCAGLWWYFIVEDLCWRTYSREESRNQVPNGFSHVYGKMLCTITPAEKYRAPTWSWASLNGRIKFVPVDIKRLCVLPLECYAKPASADPFGPVSEAWLRIKGPIFQVKAASDPKGFDQKDPLGFGTLCEITLPDGISQGEVYFDYEPEYPCFALFLDSSNCLILKRTIGMAVDNSSYKRIGLGKFLRTPAQRKANPIQNVGTMTPYGPITGSIVNENVQTITIY